MSIKTDKATWDSLHFVELRLQKLHTLKSEDGLIEKQREWKERAKIKRITEPSDDKTDFKTDLIFSVKTAKDAELLAGTPEYNFIPLDGESRARVQLMKHIWNYWWLTSKTDRVISQVVPGATRDGTGWMYEWIKTINKKK